MIKRLLVSIGLLFSLVSAAQEGTSSPYSFYGIGDQRFKGTAENRAMGGLSIFPDSTHINLQNPAGYASLKRATFSLGGSTSSVGLKTDTETANSSRTSLDYLAVGIPVGKWGFGFGLMPYTSVGYKIETNTVNVDSRRYTGEGGMNRTFLGAGYQITPQLSLGGEIQYNFGQIDTRNILFRQAVQYGTREYNNSDLGGLSFNFGAMYAAKINKKYDFYSSAIYTPESKIKSKNSRNIATISYGSTGTEVIRDSQDIPMGDTDLVIPSKFAIGAGFGENRKWMVGTELTFSETSKMTNRFQDISASYKNGTKLSVGGYYVPNYASFSSYFSTITYRAGIKYENTGLVVNNQDIKDLGFTLGFGLPVANNFSSLNIGLEYGKRGTKSAGLIQENYFNLVIGITVSDSWFRKRYYD
ncbi:hypothetical protein [Flavobacterium kingsejongi]|uniref:Aromatic hydrocarbon degradation protein n=1 Tax=Flavobacterium kingsejongi TaxID=1678728 RepID=A0A2S1LN18_9FLAO|nr:hypothetical protein [Flavobacterium kingsejongi]AWG25109.1 hypothetical protein FK004_07610 [Flavobacterium kingsejongi]